MSQRPLSPSGLPDEASADERLAQVSDDLPEPRLVLPLDDEEPDAPVLEDNAPVSLNGLSQHPADLGQHAAPSIELLLTRPDPAAAGSTVAQPILPGSQPVSPVPGWMSVADLQEPEDQLFLPEMPIGLPAELAEPVAAVFTNGASDAPLAEVPLPEPTSVSEIELVDADLDSWMASLESPSMFLDVPPVQVVMNDTVVRDVWVDDRRSTVDDTPVETVTTTTDTTTTDTTTTDTTTDNTDTTTTDTTTYHHYD